MQLGFVGTGRLTSAIVTGLCSVAHAPMPIVLSPRNATTAAALAARYANVTVAMDNQAILDGCDTIVLAVRPQVAATVLSELQFHKKHHVITLMATLSRDQVAAMVSPAYSVAKALPMPMLAHGMGATIVFPADAPATKLFSRLGKVIEVGNPAEFEALGVATATFATYFRYLATIQDWLAAHDIAETVAHEYVAALFKALASAPERSPGSTFMQLAEDYATRGGLNEQVVQKLADHGVFGQIAQSMEAAYRRAAGNTRGGPFPSDP